MTSILHITAHLGGGVGKVILNWILHEKDNKQYSHKVVCLDYANDNAKRIAKENGLLLDDCFSSKHDELLRLIGEADIVLIHWWNFPLLFSMLVREELPPCRIIMWSHISGYHPPYVFVDPLFDYADLFMFTTEISYGTKEILRLDRERKKKLGVIWSTGGVDDMLDVMPKTHDGFNVGYIGTVDYCKLHPDFLEMSSKVDVSDVNFIVIGCGDNEEIQKETIAKGWKDEFQFLGFVDNIKEYLSVFDVFGYPLNPLHYGTCDQVLAEVMSCGIVPVVLENKMEISMVEDGVTGLVVKDKDGYADAIKKLHDNPELRKRLSENAKRYARDRFSLDRMVGEWELVFNECLTLEKRKRKWTGRYHGDAVKPVDVFFESIGEYQNTFLDYWDSPLWKSKTKGTVHHYCSFYPDDKMLQYFKNKMERK